MRRRVFILCVAALSVPWAARQGDSAQYRRTVALYDVPNVSLVNQDGNRVRLPQVLAADKPVLLDFFFSSCTTVCPVLSAALSGLLKELGPRAGELRVVSIAIDSDHDTPEVLRGYKKRFEAGSEWELLTGSRDDIDRVLKAFGAYTSNKLTHSPLTFLRSAGDRSWVRIEGLVSVSDLMAEYRGLNRP
jgi:protein SCO1/2